MSGPPDPSVPDRFEERMKQLILDTLRDPLSYPDEMTNWLTTYISLQTPSAVHAASATV